MAAIDGMKGSVQSQTQVALRLTRQVLLNNAAASNAVFSPLSLHILLSMVSAGTAGLERERLLSFLRENSTDDLHASASKLGSTLFVNHPTDDMEPRLTAANGVWIDKSLTFKPAFKAVLDGAYRAVTNSVDFKNKHEEAVEEVNAWAEKETNGLIKNALPPGQISSETSIILANVLYFKAAWSSQFERQYTIDGDFHLLDGSSVRVPFMRSGERQCISVHPGFKILSLYYRSREDEPRRFCMYFLLPDSRDGLQALVDRACTETGFLDRYKARYSVAVEKFRIPKFKISLGLDALKMLSEMGLVMNRRTEMVELGPDDDGLSVANMIHKAVIEIDEEGTEAAAFSEEDDNMGCCLEQEYFEFVADHPFMFLIREGKSGTVLFTGQVLDPSQQGDLATLL